MRNDIELGKRIEVYDIISRLPLDLHRMNALNDITFEADLIRRSTFYTRKTVGLDGFLKLVEELNQGEYLLTANVDKKRYVIYMENGRIISTALSEPSSSKRVVGLRALAHFITTLLKQDVGIRIFRIGGVGEAQEETREFPHGKTITITQRELERIEEFIRTSVKRKGVTTVEAPVQKVRIIDAEEIKKKLKDVLEDVLSYHGYRLVSLNVYFEEGFVVVELVVKKKKLFGAKRLDELRDRIREEAKILLTIMEIDSDVKVKIEKAS